MRFLRFCICMAVLSTLWAVTDHNAANAQYFRFGKNKIQYEEQEWFQVRSEHFNVYFYEGGQHLADYAAKVAEEAYRHASRLFQYRISGRIPIIVYLSHAEFAVTNAVNLPINAELLQEVIMELKDSGRTILFASHRMEQVEELCDDICLISQGEIVVKGALRDIKKAAGKNSVMIEFEGSDSFLDELESTERIRIVVRSANRAEIRLLGDTRPREILEKAMRVTDDIFRFELVEPSMREIFVSAVTQQEKQPRAHE
jgi:Domain of unknown function (DUF4162)